MSNYHSEWVMEWLKVIKLMSEQFDMQVNEQMSKYEWVNKSVSRPLNIGDESKWASRNEIDLKILDSL